ncbi:hypothetical protein PV11_04977 [Exophiala sideris]|uniref:Uncharacterized protein n=1 Tax=Exophiala sideris TaxID=1016849 RepID=A0A0D1X5D3_9EURO|nr:hypothetical protein PV11_04977 [Exophiala sideris]
MAPPENTFPVSSLEQRAQFHSVNFKDKSRKLGDFDLKRDCELLELVQYSCTTPEQQAKRAMESPDGRARMECFPFVRLFRKYGITRLRRDSKSDKTAGARTKAKSSTLKPQHGKARMRGSRPQARGQQQE